MRLELPADWTVEEKFDDGVCVVTAREPVHGSRCGKTEDDQTYCDDERQVIVSIRPGSMDEASTMELSDLYPFEFEDGKWRITNAHLSKHDAVVLQRKPRAKLYAEYATREYYREGPYCCAHRNWWGMADLPSHRLAIVEVTWDFIAWDDDSMAWSDATDAQAKNNIEHLLRALR